ncbi:hypothetical protein ACTA71_004881 [Dictyostelium dimigraforme]
MHLLVFNVVDKNEHYEIPSYYLARNSQVCDSDNNRQNQFKELLQERYEKVCMVTGTRLTVEAVHIKPTSDGGSNVADNGLWLSTDWQFLFENGNGYWTLEDTGHYYRIRLGYLMFKDKRYSNYQNKPLGITEDYARSIYKIISKENMEHRINLYKKPYH